jgi:hypothetical protein
VSLRETVSPARRLAALEGLGELAREQLVVAERHPERNDERDRHGLRDRDRGRVFVQFHLRLTSKQVEV